MKKTTLLTLLVSALAVALCASAIRPTNAWYSSHTWIGRHYYSDPYWGGIYVYEEGSTARLVVKVYNQYGYDLNVSAVKVFMDWNINYSSDECSEATPFVMKTHEYHDFTINFTVPSTSVASNYLSHDYWIYIDQVNATTGPKKVTNHDPDYITWDDIYIYSTNQKEGMTFYEEITALRSTYGSSPSFSDTEAYNLWKNGTMHYYMGYSKYQSGDFDNARTYYETALGLMNEAITTELSYDLYWQEFNDDYNQQYSNLQIQQQQAYLKQTEANANASLIEANAAMVEANASMREADATFALAQAAMTQAYAWIIFGFGFMIFGIAAVIWAFKRPSHA